ncbi:MAG: hypothetical protein K9H16_11610 [Bacteroidales bacterium]|nr:hypothetical protein [Bacteroidales bacterium]
MTKKIKILLLFFVLLPLLGISQQYLVLQKSGTIKNIKYEVGDKISFQTLKGDFYVEGDISEIRDSSIMINSYEVRLDNISIVYRQRRFLKGMSGLFFIRGGIAYVAIVGVNGLINNDSPMIDEQTLIISASMVAIGLAMKPFITKKYFVKENWILKVIDFNKIENAGGW